jgi:hypothetical protein
MGVSGHLGHLGQVGQSLQTGREDEEVEGWRGRSGHFLLTSFITSFTIILGGATDSGPDSRPATGAGAGAGGEHVGHCLGGGQSLQTGQDVFLSS